MRNRIPIGQGDSNKDFSPSRRTALTRLARIAKACGSIVLYGISAEKSFASGNIGVYQGNPPNVNFDGGR